MKEENRSSERPSRLKGIETNTIQSRRRRTICSSERPSRLKGIETLVLAGSYSLYCVRKDLPV